MRKHKRFFKPNRFYRDRLFKIVFGRQENRENLLSLYNALNGSHYTNPNDLEINTIEDVLFVRMKNDLSFILDGRISLYEHQSTYNPNLPLRGFLYFAELYHPLLDDRSIYSTRQIKIPTPQFFVFYNGDKELPDETIFRLSEMFEKPLTKSGDFEWTCTMLNVNYEHNKNLMELCKPLRDYSLYVKMVKEYSKVMSLRKAIEKALKEASEMNLLNGFFKKQKAAVYHSSLYEFDEKSYKRVIREDGYLDGLDEGLKQGLQQGRMESQAIIDRQAARIKELETQLSQ